MTSRGSARELQTSFCSICLHRNQTHCETFEFITPPHPVNSVDLSLPVFSFLFSPKLGGGGINNPLKCQQIPRSPREICVLKHRGTGVLTLDIKQRFISYHGMTTTSYNCQPSEMSFSNSGL